MPLCKCLVWGYRPFSFMKGRLNHNFLFLNEQHNLTCSFKKSIVAFKNFAGLQRLIFFVYVFWKFLFAESHIVILHCRRMEVDQNWRKLTVSWLTLNLKWWSKKSSLRTLHTCIILSAFSVAICSLSIINDTWTDISLLLFVLSWKINEFLFY